MRKKVIVSVILIVLTILMITDFRVNKISVFESYFRQIETDSMKNLQHNGFNQMSEFSGYNVETDLKTMSIKPGNQVELFKLNNIGSVYVQGEEREDISLEYTMTLYSDNSITAVVGESIEIKELTRNDTIEIITDRDTIPEEVKGIKFNYTIKVPQDLKLDIDNRFGKLRVYDINSDVKLKNYYEIMEVENITGNVKLASKYGNLYVNSIHGSADINSGYNSSNINSISQGLALESSYSSTGVSGVSGISNINARYGSLELRDLNSDLNLDSKYTAVNGSRIKGKINADMRYGVLDLNNVEKDLNISGSYTSLNINLDNNLNNFQVNCINRYGDIKTNLPFEITKEDNNTKEMKGINGEGTVKINLETTYNVITLYK